MSAGGVIFTIIMLAIFGAVAYNEEVKALIALYLFTDPLFLKCILYFIPI